MTISSSITTIWLMSWVHGWHFSQSLLLMRQYSGRFITCLSADNSMARPQCWGHMMPTSGMSSFKKNWNCPTSSGGCLGVPRDGSRVFWVLGLWALPMFGDAWAFSRLDVCRSVGLHPLSLPAWLLLGVSIWSIKEQKFEQMHTPGSFINSTYDQICA